MATAEQLDSRCKIEIVGVELATHEHDMREAVMARVARNMVGASLIQVYCAERTAATGWLEWTVCIEYRSGGRMTLGAIQRSAGAEVEFHS